MQTKFQETKTEAAARNGAVLNGPDDGAQSAHHLTLPEVLRAHSSDSVRGLSDSAAARRLAAEGPNRLKEGQPVTLWEILGRQFKSFLITILIAAGLVSLAVGETADAVVIFAIVALNAALGAFQEFRAERALKSLMDSVTPSARIMRDGMARSIPSAGLVRGDLVLLQAGDLVPADLRLAESHSLAIDESPLTGESEPVKKSADGALDRATALADRSNCAYMGTRVAYGRGKGIVFAAGMQTQLGRIADLVSSQQRAQTPLQQKLAQLGAWLGVAALLLCAVIFITGLIYGRAWFEMFLVAVSLAVAAVPEGLPAVVTIALALGLQRMLKRHALIRRLAAVETLGAATVICTDKTGTLTRGVMEVERLSAAGAVYRFQDRALLGEKASVSLKPGSPLHTMLLAMALCNDAAPQKRADGSVALAGSPTEVALAQASRRGGLEEKSALEMRYPRIAEIPFDSQRKRMATAHRLPGDRALIIVKGAPDVVLPFCSRYATGAGAEPLNDNQREGIFRQAEQWASDANRLLAVAVREDEKLRPKPTPEELERDLTFLGFTGLLDPPRPESAGAVAQCRRAGIRAIMVTGDHARTALAIGKAIGMVEDSDRVLTGLEIDALSAEGLRDALRGAVLFARVSPRHKLRIVEALQAQGEVVAMTGDGSNDAPALKRADIGIAMGVRGTDVSKEAADMVLTNDNFHSIVAAVHEGRVIYANIRKVVMYLLSCNLGEILAVFVAMVSGLPLLLQPIQILWLNLVTDGLPALALSVEGEEAGTMRLKPRRPKEAILNRASYPLLLSQGLVIAAVTLAAFVATLRALPDHLALAQTAAFVTLTLSELLRAYAFRTERVSVFTHGLLSNRSMIWATATSALLLIAVVYVPLFQGWFKTAPLQAPQWKYMAPLIVLPFLLAEIAKRWVRRGGAASP